MRKESVPSKDFNRKLAAYSATAGAAIALAPNVANASLFNITTFSINSGVSYSTTPPVDQTRGSEPVFLAANASHQLGFDGKLVNFGGPSSGFIAMAVGNGTNRLVLGSAGIAKFNVGVSLENHALGTNGGLAEKSSFGGNFGNFLPAGPNAIKTGYMGFERQAGGHTYYGWLRVKVQNNAGGYPGSVTFVDHNGDGIFGAWGLKSDNITAGEIAAVPEPSITGLGLLALGAAGIRELRRRRKSAGTAAS